MKMKLKKVILFLSSVMLLSACTAKQEGAAVTGGNEQTAQVTEESNKVSEESFNIGLLQLVQHPALDESNKGFKKALEDNNIKCNIDEQNANGEVSSAQTIADKFVSEKKDLIFAIATPAAQAVAGMTKEIPILFTAVTDPASAGLEAENISGTSDLTPVKEQIDLLHKLLPDAKNVGLLYSSAEANSVFQIGLAKEECEALGLNYKEYGVSGFNEIQTIVESMIGNVDVIYIPTDNMIVSGIATVTMIANENNIPVIGSEKGQVDGGALATYGIDYFKLGYLAGEQAVKILKDKTPISEIPVGYLDDSQFELSVNEEAAKLFNIDTEKLLQK